MKRVWPVIAVIVSMAILGGVGCTASTSEPTQRQNPSAGSGQPPAGALTPPAQGPGGGQPGAFGGPSLGGTVKSVNGNTIQLTGQDGNTVTVTADDKTTIQKDVTGTLADIKVGVNLFIIGEQSNGTITARTIQIGAADGFAGMPPAGQGGAQPNPGAGQPAPGNGQPGQGADQPGMGGNPPGQRAGQPGGGSGLGGTVKSASGSTIQLTGFDGNTVTVQVDDKTTIQKTTKATVSDIQANMQITVIGESNNGTITARMIRIITNAR